VSIGNANYTPPSGNAPLELFEEHPPGREKEDSSVPAMEAISFTSILPELQTMLSQVSRPGKNSRPEEAPRTGADLLESLSGNVTSLQEHFTDRLYTALKALGVDITRKLTLRLDDTAVLVLSGEHPEKDAIEYLLQQNPEFSAVFTEIAAQSAILRDLRSLYTMALYERAGDSYSALAATPGECIYQLSLKGEMNHFYFTR